MNVFATEILPCLGYSGPISHEKFDPPLIIKCGAMYKMWTKTCAMGM